MKLSIIVGVYNHGKYLKQCFESILEQKIDFEWEVVVGYDYCLDDSLEIIKGYSTKFKNFQLSYHDTNVGACRNAADALSLTKGEYVAFIDGDDYNFDVRKYQRQVEAMDQNPSVNICFGNGYRYFQEEDRTEPFFTDPDKIPHIFDLGYFYKSHLVANPTTFMIRKSSLPQEFPDFYYLYPAVDWMLISLCASKGNIFFLNEFLSVYRVHNMSLTRTSNNIKWLEQGLGLNQRMNKFLNYQYDEYLRHKGWYFEQLVYESVSAKKYGQALDYFIKYISCDERPGLKKLRYMVATLYYRLAHKPNVSN